MIIPIITAKVVATTTKTTNEGDINFKTEFLNLRHKRFGNTSGSSINVNSCMEFMDVLPISIQQKIITDFSEFDQWFYPF